jgi:integrase
MLVRQNYARGGMASIRKRGARWRAEVCVAGVRQSDTFRTKQEAAAWALEREASIANPKTTRTLGDALTRYKTDVSTLHKGERWELLRLDALARHKMAGRKLATLARGDLVDWRDSRMQEVAPGTVAREMGLLRSVFTHTVEWGWRDASPMKGVKQPITPTSRKRRVTAEEVTRVEIAAGLSNGWAVETAMQRTAMAFLFALETAMRAGEITGLQWPDVSEKSVTLPRTKNGDVRQVPLSPTARRIIATMPKDGPVFGLNPATRDVMWRRIVKAAGFADLHFHDSRAEAIWRLSKKLDVLELARVIGHRDINSLRLYYQIDADTLADRL